MPMDMVAWRSW